MKTKVIVTAIIILLLIFRKQSNSQTCTMNTSSAGSAVTEIAIDKYGNKWMAADDDASGLVKFDGVTYTHYYPPTDLDLTCVAVDANNNIWVGSTETGISKFNGTTWTNYNPSNTGNGIPSTWIVDVAVNPVNGDIWVATATEGLARFNGTTWTKHNTTTSGGAIPSNNINCVAVDNNGNVWVSTEDGLAEYNGTTWTYNSVIGYQQVNKIKIDRKNNNVWVGTGITETTNSIYLNGSLWKYNGTSWTSYQTGMSYKIVSSITIDYWSNVYVCESYQNTSYPMWFTAFQKLDTNGNWSVLPISCISSCYVENMTTDNCNNIWLSVPYNGTTGGYGFYGSNPMTNFYANFTASSTQICQGSSVNFTDHSTGSPNNWQWNFGDGNTSTTENTSHTYNYAGNNITTLTISTSGGCHASKTDTINVMPNLTPTIGINSDATGNTICSGTLVHFTTSITNGGSSPTYQWMINSAPVGTNSSSFQTSSINNGDTVKCIMTSNIPCYTTNTASALTVFTVNSLPNAEAGENQTVCAGTSVVLNATGGTSYQWNNGVTQGVAFIPASTKTYTVTVTNANGCSATSSLTVTVNPLPTANAGSNQSVCAGGSVVLTATGGSSYQWSNGVTQGVAFIPTSTQLYTVTVTNNNGCSATSNLTVTVNPLPTAEAGNNQSVCSGSSVVLTATGGTSYQWSGGVHQSVAFVPVSTKTYTVTVTNANGCSATDSVTVTVNPLPTAYAGSNQTVCSGSSVVLNAAGGTSYQWSNGVTQNVAFVPASTHTYTVTVTNANGCSATSNLTITVNPLPTAYAGSNQAVCAGSSVVLHATGGTSYQWNNGVTQNVAFVPAATQTYTVTVTNANGCSATSNLMITVNSLPVANAGNNQTVCAGSSVILNASGGTSYQWNNEVAQGVAFIPTSTQTYTVTVTNAYNCKATDSVIVTVNPLPSVYAGSNQTVCAGDSVTLTATGDSAYQWSNGVTQGVAFIPNSSQIYTVTVTNSNGCSATSELTVTVNPLPVANAGNNQNVCAGSSVVLNATGGTSYQWSGGVTQNVAFVPISSQFYTVTVTNANGCSATSILSVTVNPLPVAEAGNDQKVCAGSSVILDATGGTSYQWNNGVTQGMAFFPVSTQTYIVTVTNSYGCSATDSVTVIVNPLPVANAGNDLSVCAGSPVVFTSTGDDYYQWCCGVYQNVPFYPTTTQTYTCTITNSSGCSVTSSVTVTVDSLPTVHAGNDQAVCAGSSVVLHATGGIFYQWSNGVTQDVAFVPASTLTYTVTVTNANGCSASDSIKVTVKPIPPTPVIAMDDDSLISNVSYGNQWYNSNGEIIGATDPYYIFTTSNNYYVISTIDGCSSDTSNNISISITGIENTMGNKGLFNANVYPNPATEIINIEISDMSYKYKAELYDGSGKLVYADNLTGKSDINISQLPAGVYYLKIFNDHGSVLKKILKTN